MSVFIPFNSKLTYDRHRAICDHSLILYILPGIWEGAKPVFSNRALEYSDLPIWLVSRSHPPVEPAPIKCLCRYGSSCGEGLAYAYVAQVCFLVYVTLPLLFLMRVRLLTRSKKRCAQQTAH